MIDSGAIEAQQQVYLRITNCVFEDNSAQNAAGAIGAIQNVTLEIQGTTFVGNKALEGVAIDVQHNATLTMQETSFIGNDLSGAGGAITCM